MKAVIIVEGGNIEVKDVPKPVLSEPLRFTVTLSKLDYLIQTLNRSMVKVRLGHLVKLRLSCLGHGVCQWYHLDYVA